MSTVGLIDVDSHNFPNLALMRISRYHKSIGDSVEWYTPDRCYDVVYKSKVFSDEYTEDTPDPTNCSKLIKGGTGYAIHKEGDKEVFDCALDGRLPDDMEKSRPDYSIYPQFDFAVAMTSRGCPRDCPFCHVSQKEGRRAVKVADVADFYEGQRKIVVLDSNITALPRSDKRELFRQYMKVARPRTGAVVDFNGGLDIRLIDDDDIEDLNHMRLDRRLHFAWDNPEEDLEAKFRNFASGFRRKNPGMVYVLVNFNSSMEQDLYRIYTLRDMGYDPYVMVYDKPSAPDWVRRMQRWCNCKIIMRNAPKFEDYDTTKEQTPDRKFRRTE